MFQNQLWSLVAALFCFRVPRRSEGSYGDNVIMQKNQALNLFAVSVSFGFPLASHGQKSSAHTHTQSSSKS